MVVGHATKVFRWTVHPRVEDAALDAAVDAVNGIRPPKARRWHVEGSRETGGDGARILVISASSYNFAEVWRRARHGVHVALRVDGIGPEDLVELSIVRPAPHANRGFAGSAIAAQRRENAQVQQPTGDDDQGRHDAVPDGEFGDAGEDEGEAGGGGEGGEEAQHG